MVDAGTLAQPKTAGPRARSRRTLDPVSRRSATLAAGTAVLAALLLGGCSAGSSGSSDDPADPAPARLAWREVQLPVPPGPVGRVAVRDATSCGGTWYVVGAVLGEDGASRPAAWTSDDGSTWRSLPAVGSEYWPQRQILTSVACRDGRIAAIGAKSGGAHGLPRTSSWYQRPDGTLVDVPAGMELYGGPSAVSVNRIAAGPAGWLISGNRRTGAAVWASADATDFRLVDDDPQLSSDDGHQTTALDEVHDGTAWALVGRAAVPGRLGPVPLAWTSSDGTRWLREPVPAGDRQYADLQRVAATGRGLVAVGIRGERFGAWTRRDDRWQLGKAFGALDPDRRGAPFVSGLAATADGAVVSVSDGTRFRLWAQDASGRWRPVATPTRPTATGDAQLTVAATPDDVLLLSDDGTSGRVWLAPWHRLRG